MQVFRGDKGIVDLVDLLTRTDVAALAHICRIADMDVGSVEYLIPKGESAAWLKAIGQSN